MEHLTESEREVLKEAMGEVFKEVRIVAAMRKEMKGFIEELRDDIKEMEKQQKEGIEINETDLHELQFTLHRVLSLDRFIGYLINAVTYFR